MKNSSWTGLALIEDVSGMMEKMKTRNIEVEVVENREAALARIQSLIPKGASVMTGGSTTLDQIGFTELLKSGAHPWKNLKEEIMAEKNEKKQNELRKNSVLADYFLGSVHAVTENGEVVVASATGSQLPSYAFTSEHVVWIVGTQKIVKNFEEAMQRVRKYVFPLEDARMKSLGYAGSVIGKIMILEKEFFPGRIKLIFVNEKLGF